MAMTRAGVLAAFLLVPIRAAAGQPAAAADSLAAAERAVVEASARDGFAAAIIATLTPDGTILWPGAPVVEGPDRVRRLLSAQRSLDSVRITWQPLGTELASDGTLGVTWGVAVAVSGGGAARLGRYIAAWRREGAAWRLAAFVPLGLIPSAAVVLTPEVAAIGRALQGGPPSQWAWHPVLAGAAASGELGFTVGESVIRSEGSAASYGKYLTIWRRLPTGVARFVTDGGTARPATP